MHQLINHDTGKLTFSLNSDIHLHAKVAYMYIFPLTPVTRWQSHSLEAQIKRYSSRLVRAEV